MSDLWKLEYLSYALSHRTMNKSFENYVVQAIWNRIADPSLKPVTQQYIRTSGGGYFIDLYFPQVGIAIEIDEFHHGSEWHVKHDQNRAASIFDVLQGVADTELSTTIQRVIRSEIDSYSNFEEMISELAERIISEAEKRKRSGTFREWTELHPDPNEYFRDKEILDLEEATLDDVGFKTIAEGHNALFGSNWKRGSGQRRSVVRATNYYSNLYGDLHIAFLKLNVEGGSGSGGWKNVMSDDGRLIREYEQGRGEGSFEAEKLPIRAWFVRNVRAPRGGDGNLYRFAGIFEDVSGSEDHRVWNRIGTRLRLIKLGEDYSEVPDWMWQ